MKFLGYIVGRHSLALGLCRMLKKAVTEPGFRIRGARFVGMHCWQFGGLGAGFFF
ncbi:hypothetical protein ACS0TY_012479 [Phlomoides rotata]